MSKIEVLQVPDGRISIKNGHIRVEIHRRTAWYETTTNTYTGLLPDELKPALLAALLEDAGAVKVTIDTKMDPDIPDGEYWLLPIREEGAA